MRVLHLFETTCSGFCGKRGNNCHQIKWEGGANGTRLTGWQSRAQSGLFTRQKLSVEYFLYSGFANVLQESVTPPTTTTQWCKFMSKNLNFAREISRGGRGRTRVGGAIKKREISLTS